METTFPQRLRDFIYYTRKTDTEFAKSIGITKANLYTYTKSTETKRLGSPHVEVLTRMLITYPELNAYWLICGFGNMLNESGDIVNEQGHQYKKLCKQCEEYKIIIEDYRSHNRLLQRNLDECRHNLNKLRQEKEVLKEAGEEKRKAV